MYKKIDMKTKEEILKSKAGTYQFTNGWTFEDSQNLTQAILDAMEEYAEQFKINNSICKIKNMIYIEPCEETLKRFEDNSIDLIITSPPYNIGKMHSNRLQFGSYANNDMKEPDYQKWQIEVLNECYRVLSENGSMFYNHKVRIKDGKAIHPMEWLLKTDFVIKQEITWDMGKSANCDKIRFFPFSERIYWLTKNPKVKLLNKNSLSDVWRLVPTHQRKDQNHIAVMPDGIVQNILDAIPNKPNVVYDPFGGSGTTMKVCKQNEIDCIISEIDKEKENTILEKVGEKRKEKDLQAGTLFGNEM